MRVALSSGMSGKGGRMRKSELIAAIQKEILRHDFGTFVDNPPSVAKGGRGVVVPGCATSLGLGLPALLALIWFMIASSCSISASDSVDSGRQAVCACISPPETFRLC